MNPKMKITLADVNLKHILPEGRNIMLNSSSLCLYLVHNYIVCLFKTLIMKLLNTFAFFLNPKVKDS